MDTNRQTYIRRMATFYLAAAHDRAQTEAVPFEDALARTIRLLPAQDQEPVEVAINRRLAIAGGII